MNKEIADPDDQTKDRLFKNAMKGEWDEVVKIYSDNPRIHTAKITKSGGTALHIAVSDGKEDFVQKLVNIIKNNSQTPAHAQEVLKMGDEKGNTPLHTAAMLGNVKMCRCIAEVDKKLIGACNKDRETPFFLAASHGHKHAFLCLLSLCGPREGGNYIKSNNGETILHCAISGDYFDLAFQIIHHYEELVNAVNERGLSPLHLLAAKPSAFRSGNHLGRCNEFIYHCIFVDKLELENSDNYKSLTPNQDGDQSMCPANYETCYSLITLLLNGIKIVTRRALFPVKHEGKPDAKNPRQDCTFDNEGKPLASDAENPPTQCSFDREGEPIPILLDAENPCEGASKHEQKDANGAQNKNQTEGDDPAQGHQLFPPNYSVCFELVKLVSKAILVILGLGSNNIRKIREKKQKNTWSIQVMNELLKRVIMYKYENDGKKPLQPQSQPRDDSLDQETKPYAFGAGGDVTLAEDAFEKSPTQKAAKGPQDKNQTENKEESPILKALHDYMNYQKKKVVMLAMENRQPHVYQLLVKMNENKEEISEMEKIESPILIAAKNGITEIVEKILEKFPIALYDTNYENKNVVLLAVENRQPHVYRLLLKITNMKESSAFQQVDHEGNSALHLAARLGEVNSWLIPGGAAMLMQWEIKWYEFVRNSVPMDFFVPYNKENKSPKDVFTETHKALVKEGGEWLNKTSESCSVVATLIATVAFAASTTVPGGVKGESGKPTLENQHTFMVFAISSLVAFSFSVTAVIMFLAIITTRYQERDFRKDLPRKLLVGITSLFVSLASMLMSFFAGHFFILRDKLNYITVVLYVVTCLPVALFTIGQFPLYFDVVLVTFSKVPRRSYKPTNPLILIHE